MKPGLPEIDLIEYAISRNAVLGLPDSGKSYGAKRLAELLLARDPPIPIIVLDPTGVWPYLRVPGKGRGYPVVVAGGLNADIPLNPQKTADLVRAVMASGVSLVIDLYDPKLSKADWRRVVEAAATVLFYENKTHGLRHIFLEEAAEFIPQQVRRDTAGVYSALEKIGRMGRNAGLGLTMISQRAEEVNKAVLELSQNMFLFRQRGRRSLEALDKWLARVAEKGIGAEVAKSIPNLGQGECWAWINNAERPVHVLFPQIDSFHPNARIQHGEGAVRAARKPIDVATFVEGIRAKLAEKDAPKATPAPSDAKAAIAPSGISEKEAARRGAIAFEEGRIAGWTEAVNAAAKGYQAPITAMVDALKERIAKFDVTIPKMPPGTRSKAATAAAGGLQAPRAAIAVPTPRAAPARVISGGQGNGSMAPGARKILTAVAQCGGLSPEGITVMCGYRSTSRSEYVRQLKAAGYIAAHGDTIVATDAGMDALGDFEPLPTGSALQNYWRGRLSGGELKLFEILAAAYPDPVDTPSLQEQSGYKSTSTSEYLRQLKARRLAVSGADRGTTIAAPTLFD